jgi:shikimate dehydrogenase
MPANYRAEIVALFGQPVDENPTGVMQEAAFAALGLPWRYITLEVAPGELPAAIAGAKAMGFRGFNLTIPHKVAAIPHLDALSVEADAIGAVNTVRREGEHWIGENTDGKGFLRALRDDAQIDPRGKRIVLLGAGGAARAIAAELLLAEAAALTVVNRGEARGRRMVEDLAGRLGGNVTFAGWGTGEYTIPPDTHILVNATSAGLFPAVDEMPQVNLSAASPDMLVADAVFNPAETKLLRAARLRGHPTLDGLSMLAYQGVIGFEMWTGRPAPEKVMKAALAQELVK